jgi:hypothetical protein
MSAHQALGDDKDIALQIEDVGLTDMNSASNDGRHQQSR